MPVPVPATDRLDRAGEALFAPLRSSDVANRVFYGASKAAEFSLCWHVLSAAGAIAVPSLRPHAVRMTLSLGAESILVNGLIKPIFDRQRPDLIDGAPHLRRPRTASFPSGHASSAAMAAGLLSDAVPAARPIWWGAAAIVATSRIHTRMHHTSDVLAGAALGMALSAAIRRRFPLP